MIRFSVAPSNFTIDGAEPRELNAKFPNYDPIRQVERLSIRRFMEAHRGYLRGRVLDFGSGTQPYRDLVDGEYVPFEKGDRWPGGADYDTVICNQVFQYLDAPQEALKLFHTCLKPGGHLVLTYPACWDEVEKTDLWRFTFQGMENLFLRFEGWVSERRFTVVEHVRRAEVAVGNFKFPLGYGLVARK